MVHLMVSDVEGSIKLKSASLVSSGNDFANASLSLVGDMSSIDTDNDSRDEHLRGKDFFDVEKYPDMTFNSTSFKKNSDTSYEVAGLLSFHGVSKQVTLNVIATKNVQPWDNKEMVGFKVKGEINRLDFGISKDSPGAMLSEAAQIKANVIFVNQ
ncbi:MAG: YceI family protein [Bacteroidota bacterium]|nr:YceI family protein [Bacteroidota bacterium]